MCVSLRVSLPMWESRTVDRATIWTCWVMRLRRKLRKWDSATPACLERRITLPVGAYMPVHVTIFVSGGSRSRRPDKRSREGLRLYATVAGVGWRRNGLLLCSVCTTLGLRPVFRCQPCSDAFLTIPRANAVFAPCDASSRVRTGSTHVVRPANRHPIRPGSPGAEGGRQA